MPGGYIGEADILIGADATNLGRDVQRQASANLKSAGAQLGAALAGSIQKTVASSAGKITAPLEQGVKRAAGAAARPLQNLVSGFRSAEAAASSFTGKMGAIGGSARKAMQPAITQVNDFVSGFRSAEAASSSFTGRMGEIGGVARKALQPAISAVSNFRTGFENTAAGLSQATGVFGTFGVAARAATNLAAAGLRGIGNAAKSGFSALTSIAKSAWDQLVKGAKNAASVAGQAIGQALKGAGTAAAAGIAGLVGTALAKGFSRLNALDQANARLRGLGIEGEKLTSVMNSADAAVTGTAYSMADAANAAGMLASAGIEAGTGMDDAMKALVATTAASGREMSEITPIYTKIAAAGKVTGETMAQMLDAGINANGALQESLGKTSEEITAMVSAGEIDFETFVTAINGDLSMLAAAMGGTLGGMVSNVGAAFGRIGAEVQKPIFDALLVAMPAVLDFAKRLATAVKEFMAPLQGSLEPLALRLKDLFEGMNPSVEGISAFADSLAPLIPLIGAVVGVSSGLLTNIPIVGEIFGGLSGPMGLVLGLLVALTAVDPSTMLSGLENIGGFLQAKLPGLLQQGVELITKGVSNLVQNLPMMLKGVTTILVNVLNSITQVLPQIIPVLVNAIGMLIPSVIQALLQAIPQLLDAAMQLFGGLIEGLLQSIPVLVETLVAAIPMLIDTLVAAVPMILEGALQMFMGILDALVVAVPQIITALVNALPRIIESLVNAIPQIIEAGISFFLGLIDALFTAVPQIISALIGAIPQILDALVGAIPQLIDAGINLFLGLITALVEAIPVIVQAVIEMIPTIFTAIVEAIPQIIEAGFNLFMGLINGLWEALPKIWDAITQDLLPSIWEAITGGGDKAEETGKGLGDRAAAGLSSTSGSFSSAGSALASSANSSLSAYTPAMQTTGAQLGSSATAGLASTQTELTTTASVMGSSATSTLGSYTGQMTSAAAGLGQGAVTGLSGETENAKLAAADLANAATLDVSAKVDQATAAGKRIASAFANGIKEGATAVRGAATSIATAAQQVLSQVSGFVTIGRNLAGGITQGVQRGTPELLSVLQLLVMRAQTLLISGVVQTIGSAFESLWRARISPTLLSMVTGTTISLRRVRDLWASMAASLRSILTSSIIPTLNLLSSAVLTGPPLAFARAVGAIAREWSKIQEASKKPVRFVINYVMGSLIGAMNQIPGVNVPRPSLPAGFARGGILPGYSTMGQGDDQLIMARRGEGMMVSEALRTPADKAAFLAANAAGRKGIGFASMLNGYARGGLVTPLPKGSFSVSQPWHGGHNGIDLAAAMGTKIYAAAKGIVQLASSVPMGGNEIYIQHDNGLGTRYSHLSSFAARVGQVVRQNQVIGRVGSTGMSTGPHLHYMVHNPGRGPNSYYPNVNPAPYLGVYGTEVDGYLDVLQGLTSAAARRFTDQFALSNMWNRASYEVMGEGIRGALAYAKTQLGTDDGAGRTGRVKGPTLFDTGGIWKSGTMGVNLSGADEGVLTNPQLLAVQSLADALTSGLGGLPLEPRRSRGGLGGASDPELRALLEILKKLADRPQVMIEEGAIVFENADDPAAAAQTLIDEIAERLGS